MAEMVKKRGRRRRHGGRTMQQGMHIAGQAERGTEAAGEAVQRGMPAPARLVANSLNVRRITSARWIRGGGSENGAEQTTEGQRTLMTLPRFGGVMQEVQPAEAPAVFCHRLYHSLVSDRTDTDARCAAVSSRLRSIGTDTHDR